MPSVSRPPEMSSSVISSFANGTGWRKFGDATSGPEPDALGHARGRRERRDRAEPRGVAQRAPREMVVRPRVIEAERLGALPDRTRLGPAILRQDHHAQAHARTLPTAHEHVGLSGSVHAASSRASLGLFLGWRGSSGGTIGRLPVPSTRAQPSWVLSSVVVLAERVEVVEPGVLDLVPFLAVVDLEPLGARARHRV